LCARLKPLFAPVEEKTLPRFTRSDGDLGSLKERFEKEVPDYHLKGCLLTSRPRREPPPE